ncbi:hypothetical protein EVAR_68756_1 [Eumeta japonica]|uniref:Uncharacterized protein n=1 Tax=Eumeta variegata TaxID=151549 RepID=A0A4C2A304_EUMVA|nr:hypothetical protein EVAR_68756_1 [Eumeta japonica]
MYGSRMPATKMVPMVFPANGTMTEISGRDEGSGIRRKAELAGISRGAWRGGRGARGGGVGHNARAQSNLGRCRAVAVTRVARLSAV